jgi:branched-chain amino acid transport system ATP-binding protein
LLQVEELVAAYGPVRAVDGVSLDVPTGSITAVLGANGAGKTTLLRAVSGLIRARSGRVRFGDRDVTNMRAEDIVRLGLAHVPEGGGVIGELTVDENLRLGALWRSDRADRGAALREVYDLFPRLGERRAAHASSLSGGERQMLSIGRALMGRPKMLLLDEPSLGLAPLVTRELFGILERIAREQGMTVLIVEQNANLVLKFADYAYVLESGRISLDGPAGEVMADEGVKRSYLGY